MATFSSTGGIGHGVYSSSKKARKKERKKFFKRVSLLSGIGLELAYWGGLCYELVHGRKGTEIFLSFSILLFSSLNLMMMAHGTTTHEWNILHLLATGGKGMELI
jgi:hypothetical protein